jgi:hypothetical protein
MGLLMVLATLEAWADNDPFYTSNENPLVMSYGIPAPESARLLDKGEHSSSGFLTISTIATESGRKNERLTLDGESYRMNFRLRYGWSRQLQLGMDLSALRHEGGRLDGFVENWHDWFGLPQGDRPDQPKNRLLYKYAKDNETVLELKDNESGIGDLRLSAIYQLKNTDDSQLAVRGGIKLPLGDADKMTGSESTDAYVDLLYRLVPDFEQQSVTLHAGLGLLHTGSGDILNDIKEDIIPYGHTTLAWSASGSITLKLQLNGHGKMYDSRLGALNDNSVELIMGGTVKIGTNWKLDLSMSEDILGDSAPDFTILLGLRYQPGTR